MPSIVIPACKDSDFGIEHLINEPMLLVDSPGPAAAEIMPERLGLAETYKGVPLRLSNQSSDPQRLGAVLFDPPGQILECRGVKF